MERSTLPSSRRRGWLTAAGPVVSFSLGGWVLPHLRWEGEPGSNPAALVQAASPPAVPVDEPIARAAARVMPAVVKIDTVSHVSVGAFGDDFLDSFFGRRTMRQAGLGSG